MQHKVATYHRISAMRHPTSTIAQWVRQADADARAELERRFGELPDEIAFGLLEQRDYLDAIERVQARDGCSYGEAMRVAAREAPDAYERYLDALGRQS